MTDTDTSSPKGEKPRRTAPAVWLATFARYGFKPGRVNREKCSRTTREGKPCGHIAIKGLGLCTYHGRGVVRAQHERRPRCEAWNVKRPRGQCTHAAVTGGLCGKHAWHAAHGGQVERVPAGQRVRYVPKRVTRAAPRTRIGEHTRAAPHELASLPVWRMARPGQRVALMDAWHTRDTSPEAWRKAVRAVLAAQAGEGGE